MLKLRVTDDGVAVPVVAKPGARVDKIVGLHDGRVRVAVSAAPEKGKANAAIAAVLAKSLGVPKRNVVQTVGLTSREKVFVVSGKSTAEIIQAFGAIGIPTENVTET